LGAIGVDINADHLAVSETDRFGNLVLSLRIDLHTYGKTRDQAKALIGDAGVRIADLAKSKCKPIVIEKLDFSKKKAELEATHKTLARMLSSFACNKVISSIKAAAFRRGVEVIEVNPAYTSVIGAVNHAQRNGISVHMGAATAIARRGLGLSEKPPKRGAIVPARNGGHVTFCTPARMRMKHVWSHWGKIKTTLKAAHVAHHRSGMNKKMPAPLSPEMRTLGSIRSSTVQSHSANRQQHCLAGVLDDVPL
jgi:IS605 OrfB family transposase